MVFNYFISFFIIIYCVNSVNCATNDSLVYIKVSAAVVSVLVVLVVIIILIVLHCRGKKKTGVASRGIIVQANQTTVAVSNPKSTLESQANYPRGQNLYPQAPYPAVQPVISVPPPYQENYKSST